MTADKLDLFEPLQGRHWLKLWVDDPVSGIRLKANLSVGREVLGFSASTNRHGLRGPDRQDASGVILGTSFAMGLAVDDGDNWWEHLAHPGDWLNLSLPVGLAEMIRLLDGYHTGEADTLCFVYHPNLLQQCSLFERLTKSGKSAFEEFHWRTGLRECLWLSLRRRLRRQILRRRGEFLIVPDNGMNYFVDGRYCRVDLNKQRDLLVRSAERLAALCKRFRRSFVVRVRIKQDLAAKTTHSPTLSSLGLHYDEVWEAFRSRLLLSGARATLVDMDSFSWNDFHSRDTHWNARGNRRFASMLNEIIT